MGRVRSWLAAPLGSRLLGAALAVAGVALLLLGLFTLRGRSPEERPPAAGGPSASLSASEPSSSSSPSPSPSLSPSPAPRPSGSTPAASTTPSRTMPAPPPRPARAPVTVLNNSTVTGLGQRVAGQIRTRGWEVPVVGNFAGRIPVTTVYYTPGDAAGERAARALAAQFAQIDRVSPRYDGLPPAPAGLVLVVTRTWPS